MQNPSLLMAGGKRYTIAPPSIHRDGNKKTVFANIADICKRMHRQPEHTIQFMFAELGTTGSIDGSGRLVIRGKFSQAQIENVAGPVGEALIMTAFGLVVAIPAVLAYNILGRLVRQLAEELDGFARDLHVFVCAQEA